MRYSYRVPLLPDDEDFACVTYTDAFEAYQAATGAVMDWDAFMLRITNEQYANLQSLFFHIGDVSTRSTFSWTSFTQQNA